MSLFNVTCSTLSAPARKKTLSQGIAAIEVCALSTVLAHKPFVCDYLIFEPVLFHSAFGYLFWLPTIVKALTRSSLATVGWLSAAPLLASAAGVYGSGHCQTATATGVCIAPLPRPHSAYVSGLRFWFPARVWCSYAMLVATGLFSKGMLSPFWSMPSLLFPSGLSGGARGIINGIGNMGGFAGPVLVGWLARWTSSVQSSVTMLLPGSTAGPRHTEQIGNP